MLKAQASNETPPPQPPALQERRANRPEQLPTEKCGCDGLTAAQEHEETGEAVDAHATVLLLDWDDTVRATAINFGLAQPVFQRFSLPVVQRVVSEALTASRLRPPQLLPTSHLKYCGCVPGHSAAAPSKASPRTWLQLKQCLKLLDQTVTDLLEAAVRRGCSVAIVSAASEAWVHESCKRFLPGVHRVRKTRDPLRSPEILFISIHANSGECGSVQALEAHQIPIRAGADAKARANPARLKADLFWEQVAPLRDAGRKCRIVSVGDR